MKRTAFRARARREHPFATPAHRTARPRRPGGPGRRVGHPPDVSPGADIVAHELRTPLTSLMLGSQILLHGAAHDRYRRALADDLAAETLRLADAVEDLLVVTWLAGDLPSPEPVSVQHVVRRELAVAASANPAVRFRALLPPEVSPVTGDETSLRHLVHDLVAGGVAGAGGGGRVEASMSQPTRARVRLRVTGTGRRPTIPGHAGPVSRPPRATLRVAALRALAARLGASLMLATTRRMTIGQAILPAAHPGREDDPA